MFQSSYVNNLSSFNLSNKRINYFITFAYYLYFSFFSLLFFIHVIFAHDILIGIFAMSMVFPPIFYMYHPFGFSI